ncbi:MAG: T9SS type A sorting domain-containing protein [Bacteroidetes bacterium]|nr:T9SS type A sorting domain-containing protein [Bacteroidota bacterium]
MKSVYKTIFLSVILLLISNAYSQQYWLSLNSPVAMDLRKGYFLDSLTGWVCGDSGLIMKTSNGGINWARQNSKLSQPVHDIFFLNKRLGWALSWDIYNPLPPYGTVILRTTDGGINWDTSRFVTENVYIRTVFFQDSLHGFMGGNFRNIMRTTDGGANWLDVYIDSMIVAYFPVNTFTFFSRDYGYACGGQMDFAGVVWRTTDRGIHWSPNLVSAEPAWSVFFLDSMRIMCMTGDFEYGPSIVSSSNSGATWKYTYLGFFGFPSETAFRTKSEAWTPLGFARKFIYSLDSGYTWTEYETPDSAEVNNVIFPDNKHGYAFCSGGKILKYNSAVIGISNNETQNPEKFTLGQNYPNPFNPRTNISYELKTPSYVVLKVYDISGKEIRTLINGYQNRGKYNLSFSGDNLPTGVYFYEIAVRDLTGKSNSFVKETKKMVLLK